MTAPTAQRHVYVLGKCDYDRNGRRNHEVTIEWTWDGKRFSMSANVWNSRRTDVVHCGQMVDQAVAFFPNDSKAQKMRKVWERWHLNDMKAGTPAQEAFLREHPITVVYPESYYDKAKAALAAAALDPDNGYHYGSAWKLEELPPEVIAEIESW